MKSVRYFQHTFVPSLIKKGGVVLDCGANHGEFSRWISEHTPAVVHGFEPDPELFDQLPELPRVRFYPLAIADRAGTLRFNVGEDRRSSLHYASTAKEMIEVQAVRLENFCTDEGIHRIDLLKLDIEGEEIPVLQGASDEFFRNIGQITVEFHDAIDPGQVPAIKRLLQRFASLGFYSLKVSYRDYADILLINQSIHALQWRDKLSLLLLGKYYRGVLRNLKRRMRRLNDLEP